MISDALSPAFAIIFARPDMPWQKMQAWRDYLVISPEKLRERIKELRTAGYVNIRVHKI